MYLVIAAIGFLLFFGHVLLGKFTGTSIIGDIGELLLIIFASALFTIAILKAEREQEENRVDSFGREKNEG